MIARRLHCRARSTAGFTLVEVILAIVIALGILVVLLYFYHQATHVRGQAILETERIAAARLIMDRITSELRTIPAGFTRQPVLVGSSNAIEFIRTDVPSYASWMGGPLGRATFPVTDLRQVRYYLRSGDETNVFGLIRAEEPLVQTPLIYEDEDFEEMWLLASDNPPPVIEEIRFMQFRYWSGTNWLDSWNSSASPLGVEVSLGPEPITNTIEIADYAGEIFRRVIYLGHAASGLPGRAALVETNGWMEADP